MAREIVQQPIRVESPDMKAALERGDFAGVMNAADRKAKLSGQDFVITVDIGDEDSFALRVDQGHTPPAAPIRT